MKSLKILCILFSILAIVLGQRIHIDVKRVDKDIHAKPCSKDDLNDCKNSPPMDKLKVCVVDPSTGEGKCLWKDDENNYHAVRDNSSSDDTRKLLRFNEELICQFDGCVENGTCNFPGRCLFCYFFDIETCTGPQEEAYYIGQEVDCCYTADA